MHVILDGPETCVTPTQHLQALVVIIYATQTTDATVQQLQTATAV